MHLIIDIIFLQNCNEKRVMKEVSVTMLDSKCIGQWICKPPHKYNLLSDSIQRKNEEDISIYHGINWNVGDCDLNSVKCNIYTMCWKMQSIFTYGKEKVDFLNKMFRFKKKIIDLAEYGCPWIIKIPNKDYMCQHHNIVLKKKYNVCALSNVLNLKKYIIDNHEKFNLSKDDCSNEKNSNVEMYVYFNKN